VGTKAPFLDVNSRCANATFYLYLKKRLEMTGRERPSWCTVPRKADDIIRADLFLHAAACCTKHKIILRQSFEFFIQDSIKKSLANATGFKYVT
jgi:hypothetical protein